MPRRWVFLVWLVVGLVVWMGVFGLYVDLGVQWYLRALAEFEAGHRSRPSLVETMAAARARGAVAASLWTLFIAGVGIATTMLAGRRALS